MTPELRESFRNARYQVRLPTGAVDLAVDRQCEPLGEWLRANGFTCAALMTAHNPAGRQRADSLNTASQAMLEARLLQGGYTMMRATAFDPSGGWPPEASLFVPGISQADAMALASDFGQLAILWSTADSIPRLVETGQAR
jgi:Protein of unknown function (DUF3293)